MFYRIDCGKSAYGEVVLHSMSDGPQGGLEVEDMVHPFREPILHGVISDRRFRFAKRIA